MRLFEIFVSYLHHIVKLYHTSNTLRAIYHTSANVKLILYNSSVNKKITLCYFRYNDVCFAQFCQGKYKDKAELFISKQHTEAFHVLMHVLNELSEPLGALKHWP